MTEGGFHPLSGAPLGVILAGGQARRMGGGDKGRLVLKGQSLFERVIDRLAPQTQAVAINANGDAARLADLGLPVLPDSIAAHPGPLAGVLAGLDWAADQGASHIVTAAADTPFFPADLTPQLILVAETSDAPIALAATRDDDGRLWAQPTFGLWPVALRNDLERALLAGTRKVLDWTDRHGAVLAEFPVMGMDPFFNVNRPEDLARASEMLP